MSIEQENTIDFATVDRHSGNLWLTISDHLPWDSDEGAQLMLLQNKLNSYLRFIESGEILEKVPDAKGRAIVIDLALKFPLSANARVFFVKARETIEASGIHVQYRLVSPD